MAINYHWRADLGRYFPHFLNLCYRFQIPFAMVNNKQLSRANNIHAENEDLDRAVSWCVPFEDPHQPQSHDPVWLLRASTVGKAVVIYSLLACLS